MSDWMIWFMLAAVLVILEMATGTLYLLMLGIGLAAGGLVAMSGAAPQWQFLVAASVGAAIIFALSKTKYGKIKRRQTATDPNVNLDVGQTVSIDESQWTGGEGVNTARVMYRGAQWDVELAPGSRATSGSFVIREIRGSRLIVSNPGANIGSEPQNSHSL